MRNLSIKFKVTLWYTLFMTLLVVAVLWFLFTISSSRILSDAKLRLQDTVLQCFREIEYDEGVLEFDDDINYLGEGVYLSVYDAQGNLLYGRIPSHFQGASTLIMDEMQQIQSEQILWYVYDYCQQIDGYGNLWVRGITSQTHADETFHRIVRMLLILLPFFVVCIALGGYLIIRRTLAPLADMTSAARRISEGTDLSERIRLGEGTDEVHQLAHTFDQMMEKLQTSFESEKQFTSDVSHELRTPVTVIISQCEYAAQEGISLEESQNCLAVIMMQAKKMSKLISQLLTLARTDSGKQKLHLETLNLSELTEITVEEQRSLAASKHITITTNIQPDILLCADETMIMRMLINLISNSITYGKEQGNTTVTLTSDASQIICSVSDNGIGIEDQQLDKIWKRFYQADASRSSSESGVGLGLPMVKWIVKAHGGSVSVDSTPGVGSCFTIRFPLTK